MKISKILLIFSMFLLFSSTSYAAELHITDNPESEVQTIIFESNNDAPDGWLPLKQVSEYLPIDVNWDEESRSIIIDSEPNKINWKWLAHEEINIDNMGQHSKDLKIVNGVTYCSPWFLANRLIGVGFVHENEVWYCNAGLDFDGRVKAAMLELQVITPEEYAFINKYLTGGIMMADECIEGAVSYVYPYSAKPVCYIVDDTLTGATLASTIAHEAWHVYDAKRGICISEYAANAYEKKVLNLLLREARIKNGTIILYE